jgi:hypothetical protein
VHLVRTLDRCGARALVGDAQPRRCPAPRGARRSARSCIPRGRPAPPCLARGPGTLNVATSPASLLASGSRWNVRGAAVIP